MTTPESACALCATDGGEVIVRTTHYRIVLVDDARYPGFCRVIWNSHAAELTDLVPADRSVLMTAVCKVEAVLRQVMAPHKINLAALGNMVPHLHWHVIPRFADDAHFPAPVWAEAVRVPVPSSLDARVALLPALRLALEQAFAP
jgi:diadenosine tetraphosphate (Ap4A) HIT family hydrolase